MRCGRQCGSCLSLGKVWRLNFPFLSMKSFHTRLTLAAVAVVTMFTHCLQDRCNIFHRHYDFAVCCRRRCRWMLIEDSCRRSNIMVFHGFWGIAIFVFFSPFLFLSNLKILCPTPKIIEHQCYSNAIVCCLFLVLFLFFTPSHGFIQKTSRSSIRKVTINWLVSTNKKQIRITRFHFWTRMVLVVST